MHELHRCGGGMHELRRWGGDMHEVAGGPTGGSVWSMRPVV